MNSMTLNELHYGATREDWLALSFMAGITSDLLPYVADPEVQPLPLNADGSKRTHWQPGAKMPGLVDRNGYGHGIKDWQKKLSTDRDVDRWADDARLGICIATRRVRAIDVDIGDADQARAIEQLIRKHFGALPTRRRGNSSKFLCAVIVDPGHPIPKKVARTEHGIVEVLTDLQQFYAVGMHPSGERYVWDGGTPTDFPEVSLGRLESFWRELEAQFATEASVEFAAGKQIVKARTFEDVDDPVVEYLETEGWVKSVGRDGKVYVRCPFEDGHSKIDTDHTATVYFPRGVGGLEQGHFKCQHASCAKRNDGDFLNAIGYGVDEFPVVVVSAEQEARELPPFERTGQGQIQPTQGNAILALRRGDLTGFDIRYDQFRDEIVVSESGRGEWRPFRDTDYTRLAIVLKKAGFAAELGNDKMRNVVAYVAEEQTFDTAMVWLDSLKWDGVPRVDTFVERVFGVEEREYAKAVSRYIWTALAGRVMQPGIKADMAVILCGDQGLRKTDCIERIAPDPQYFVEIDFGAKEEDLVRKMRGKLVAEFAELRGLHTKDQESIKAFITRKWEEWVPKYKEFSTRFGRRLIFFGTTNKDEFLADETGNRRWLPLQVQRADRDLVSAERLQLWAEGLVLFEKHGILWQDAQTLAERFHDRHMIRDSWEGVVRDWLDMFDNLDGTPSRWQAKLSVVEVLVGALKFEPRQIKRLDEMRCGNVLRALGFERKRGRVNGERAYFYEFVGNNVEDVPT